MARPLRSQRSSKKRKSAKLWEDPTFDSSISWGAQLKQPSGHLSPGSVQSLVVGISAPVVLEEQVVELFYDESWHRAEWVADPSHNREAALLIEARGRIHRVLARVHAGQQLPIMFAGYVRVRS